MYTVYMIYHVYTLHAYNCIHIQRVARNDKGPPANNYALGIVIVLYTVGPLIIESPQEKERVSTGVL